MISIIIDTIWYLCCFNRNKPKEQSPFDIILKNIDDLAHHEIEFIENHITKKKKINLKCCF